jgi:outer membrane receptor protein involved in Fe transport
MKRVLFVIVPLILASAPSFAQVSGGKITGAVQDGSGGVMPGVAILIRNLATNVTREAVTNERGQYEVTSLAPGQYQIEAELPGFKRHSRGPITIQVNQETRVDVTLELGALEETITVVGDGLIVQTTTSTVGNVVEQKQIVELPLSGRNFADLGLLTPGVTTRGQATSSGATGSTFVVHGQRNDANNFQLDGVANVSLGGNTLQARPNVDAVQEFKIQTSNFSAEFGRNAGSIVTVVTKSGSNKFSGNVWEFLRDDQFQARNYFALSDPPPLSQNQFGGTIGGPLVIPGIYAGRNRSFFFGSYEGFRLTRGLTRQTVVATQRERDGDFSFLNRNILDPLTGQPFPGNRIPVGRMSQAALNLLSLMPLPNIEGTQPRQNNYVSSPSQEQDYDQYMWRFDHSFNQRWNVFYRHFLQDNESYNPFQGASPAGYVGFPATNEGRTQHLTVGLNTVFSASMLNEFRVGFSQSRSAGSNLPLLNPVDYGVNYVRDQNLIGGLGLPDMTITGMSGIGNTVQGPSRSKSTEFQISDVMSAVRGNHNLKWGGEIRRGKEDPDNGFFTVGRFVFNGAYTGDSFADFLIGRASEFNYGTGRTQMIMENWNYGAFFQDDWRITDRLTLNLGVRYDYFSPIIDSLGQTSTWVIDRQASPGVPQSGAAHIVIAGQEGLPNKGTYFPDNNNWQPRVGFSWDVWGNGRLAVRGGAGVFFNQLRNNLTLQQILSYPFYEQPVVRDTTLENPIRPVAGPPVIGQLYVTDPNIIQPYTVVYSIGYQWQFMNSTMIEMAYVGNKGYDLLQFREMNQPIYVAGQTTTATKDRFRPYPGFSSVLRSTNWGASEYNGIETSLQRRFANGLGFQAAYTLSGSKDYSSHFHSGATSRTYVLAPQDDANIPAEWAYSDHDARQRLVISEVYELPFGPGKPWLTTGAMSHIFGSWNVASIWTWQSGFPYNVFDGSDICLTAGSYTPTCRPNLIGDPILQADERTPSRWFNAAAFQRAPLGQFGDAPRNSVRGPGLANTDLSITKRIRLDGVKQGMNGELRFEVFNLFNRANFGPPTNDFSSGAFGRISSTATEAREFQLGFKFSF